MIAGAVRAGCGDGAASATRGSAGLADGSPSIAAAIWGSISARPVGAEIGSGVAMGRDRGGLAETSAARADGCDV